ncbi:MAG TPA: hypothetical protein VF753_16885 [Terriglobales bacterium]
MILLDNAPIPTPEEARQRDAERRIREVIHGIQTNDYEPDRRLMRTELERAVTAHPVAAAAIIYQLTTGEN